MLVLCIGMFSRQQRDRVIGHGDRVPAEAPTESLKPRARAVGPAARHLGRTSFGKQDRKAGSY